jgi:hypothetical protein
MLNWVNTGTGRILVYNDISGEHAWQNADGKALGVHESHKGGYDLDARYYDENGQYVTGMCGQSYNKVDGYYIRQVVQAAQEEVENNLSPRPNVDRLVKWINVNRTLLEQVAADPKVKLLYIGLQDWFWQPLIWGKFADGILDIPGVDIWLGWPDKVEMLGGHESHIHVRLMPKGRGQGASESPHAPLASTRLSSCSRGSIDLAALGCILGPPFFLPPIFSVDSGKLWRLSLFPLTTMFV